MMQKRLEQQELMRSERCLDFDAREMDEYCSQSSGDEQEELKAQLIQEKKKANNKDSDSDLGQLLGFSPIKKKGGKP